MLPRLRRHVAVVVGRVELVALVVSDLRVVVFKQHAHHAEVGIIMQHNFLDGRNVLIGPLDLMSAIDPTLFERDEIIADEVSDDRRNFIPVDRGSHRRPVFGSAPPLRSKAVGVVLVAEQNDVDSSIPAARADVARKPTVRVVSHGNFPRRAPETEGDLDLLVKVVLHIDDLLFLAKKVVGEDQAALGHG